MFERLELSFLKEQNLTPYLTQKLNAAALYALRSLKQSPNIQNRIDIPSRVCKIFFCDETVKGCAYSGSEISLPSVFLLNSTRYLLIV